MALSVSQYTVSMLLYYVFRYVRTHVVFNIPRSDFGHMIGQV